MTYERLYHELVDHQLPSGFQVMGKSNQKKFNKAFVLSNLYEK